MRPKSSSAKKPAEQVVTYDMFVSEFSGASNTHIIRSGPIVVEALKCRPAPLRPCSRSNARCRFLKAGRRLPPSGSAALYLRPTLAMEGQCTNNQCGPLPGGRSISRDNVGASRGAVRSLS